MTAESTAKALGGRKAGCAWMACCPAHEDREPSLSITTGEDGRVLVRCHAGCDQHDVIAALRAQGAWETASRNRSCFSRKTDRRILERTDPDAAKRKEAALAIWQASQPAEGTPAETYLRSRGLALPASASLSLSRRIEASFGQRLALRVLC